MYIYIFDLDFVSLITFAISEKKYLFVFTLIFNPSELNS